MKEAERERVKKFFRMDERSRLEDRLDRLDYFKKRGVMTYDG